jgi:redox-sensitive bicupin YhaK (pirin superfamily)
MPDVKGVRPVYDQKSTELEKHPGQLRLIASGNETPGAVKINQDTNLYACILNEGASVRHVLPSNRYSWLQVARGDVQLNGVELRAGDGAGISAESNLEIVGKSNSEFLLFDLK